ncbi:hypothetical protein M9H77_27240 [Catharanthus roseus]|uniref:Uncharacterized protein n=1 Tax=Catharanthus roseus TaxID=4058 RepID=A0ACC0ADE9_CATRO|nr:hypothetical protein M9H77_27240 [Catharanthus roseus]
MKIIVILPQAVISNQTIPSHQHVDPALNSGTSRPVLQHPMQIHQQNEHSSRSATAFQGQYYHLIAEEQTAKIPTQSSIRRGIATISGSIVSTAKNTVSDPGQAYGEAEKEHVHMDHMMYVVVENIHKDYREWMLNSKFAEELPCYLLKKSFKEISNLEIQSCFGDFENLGVKWRRCLRASTLLQDEFIRGMLNATPNLRVQTISSTSQYDKNITETKTNPLREHCKIGIFDADTLTLQES